MFVTNTQMLHLNAEDVTIVYKTNFKQLFENIFVLNLILPFHVHGCFAFMYVWVPHAHLVLREASKGIWPLELDNCKLPCGLGIEPMSSQRECSALNQRQVSIPFK